MKAPTHQWPFWKRALCLTQSSILIDFQSWSLKTWRHLPGFWDREGTLHQAGDLRWNVSALPFIMLLPLRLYHNKAPYALRHDVEERHRHNKVQNSDDRKLNGVQRWGVTCTHRTKSLPARRGCFVFVYLLVSLGPTDVEFIVCAVFAFMSTSLVYEHSAAFSSSLSWLTSWKKLYPLHWSLLAAFSSFGSKTILNDFNQILFYSILLRFEKELAWSHSLEDRKWSWKCCLACRCYSSNQHQSCHYIYLFFWL